VQPENDPFIAISQEAVHSVTEAFVPSAFWVDFFPWMKYIPAWFPGAGFRRKARKWSELVHVMIEKPYTVAKQRINEGSNLPSFVSHSLEKLKDEQTVKDVAATMFTASSDTTIYSLSNFISAMLKHPDVQRKAQHELDTVLKGSLPAFEDQDSLPYLMAVVMETLRWNAAAPFGVPHCVISDDIYDGYYIPAGAMVMANAWSMLNDEEMYPDPFRFNPDRFLKDGKLNPEIRDPRLIAFGFGRRICPGRHMAFSSLWITAASILATMNITKAIDANGNVVEPSGEYESMLQMPKSFECNIKSRSKQAEALIRSALEEG